MAEFCEKCLIEVMGITKEEHPEWWNEESGLCEGCGYKYLKKQGEEHDE